MVNVGLLVVIVLTFAGVLWVTSYHKNRSMMGLGLALITAFGVMLIGQSFMAERNEQTDVQFVEELARKNGYAFNNNELVKIGTSGRGEDANYSDNVTLEESEVTGMGERTKTVDHELHFMAQMPALRSSSHKHSKRSSRSHRK